MRRSKAPSMRLTQNVSCHSPLVGQPVLCDNSKIINATPVPNATRNTESILNLLTCDDEELSKPEYDAGLSKFAIENNGPTFEADQRLSLGPTINRIQERIAPQKLNSSVSIEGKRIFNVVWGKQSTKKHKTWEGDGTLEVGEKSAVLKDEEGKVLGRSSGVKCATLDEGSRLFVGSKEVEIVEAVILPDVGTKRAVQHTQPEPRPTIKRTKVAPVQKSKQFAKSLHGNSKPFLMPQPPHKHQA